MPKQVYPLDSEAYNILRGVDPWPGGERPQHGPVAERIRRSPPLPGAPAVALLPGHPPPGRGRPLRPGGPCGDLPHPGDRSPHGARGGRLRGGGLDGPTGRAPDRARPRSRPPLSLGLTLFLGVVLLGSRPHDPATFAFMTTLLASALPARRADAFDPAVALRSD